MATQVEAARWLLYRTAFLKDQGANIAKDSAITKLFVSETADDVTRKSLQVHGPYGFTKDFKIERLYRDAKIGSLAEGVNEVQRVIISANLLR
jgi:butyryl-CoA dehydrogenase